MEERGYTKQYSRRRVFQAVSIPFLWEESPGTAKKEWKPEVAHPVVASAPVELKLKLIASVPFKWEEKPGTPLRCFSPSETETETELVGLGSSDLPADACTCSDEQTVFDPELDVAPAAPSFLDIPSSPNSDTDGSTSSYVTGCSSPVGPSFLECLFPLYQPDGSFLEKVKKGPLDQQELMVDEFDRTTSTSLVARTRAPTLGELIMMSRGMSYQRKAIQVRKHHISMKFAQKGALGCCFFGNASMIGGLHRNEDPEPRLNLF